MDIQNYLSGFVVSWITFMVGIVAAFLLRKKLFRLAEKKAPTTT